MFSRKNLAKLGEQARVTAAKQMRGQGKPASAGQAGSAPVAPAEKLKGKGQMNLAKGLIGQALSGKAIDQQALGRLAKGVAGHLSSGGDVNQGAVGSLAKGVMTHIMTGAPVNEVFADSKPAQFV